MRAKMAAFYLTRLRAIVQYFKGVARCFQDNRFRRLALLTGACVAEVALARGETNHSLTNATAPTVLRPTLALQTLANRTAEAPQKPRITLRRRVQRASTTEEFPGLSMSFHLSMATDTAAPPVGPEQPVAFEAVQAGPSAAAPTARTSPTPEELPDLTAIGWVIPPIRWGGTTSSSYNWNSSPGGGTAFNQTHGVNLRASSYIYQPWYAQVSGDVGLFTGASKQGGGDSASSAGRSTSMTYGGNLSLFPQSRFPFQAYVQTSDSRASANAQSQHYTSTRLGARQSYRPETGQDSYSANGDRSIVSTGTVRSVVDAFQGAYATTIADHVLNSSGRYSRTSGDVDGQGSSLMALNGTHSWRADEELSVASSASFSNNQIRMLTGTGLSSNTSQVYQLASSATWLPDEELPLVIVGGGNFLHINTVTETATAGLTNLNGYVNANYRFSQNLSTTAGLTLTQNLGSGSRRLSSGQNASVSYSGNPLMIGDFSYSWGVGSGISNQIASGAASNRNLSVQAQHSVGRSFVLSKENSISLNAGQSYSLAHNNTSGQSGVLSHTAGASWRQALGERTQSSMSATFSDSMSTNAFASHNRSYSAMGNVQSQLSRRSAVTASVNAVISQQLKTTSVQKTATPAAIDGPAISTDNATLNGYAQIAYSHRSPFDIANLFYTASFQANASQTNLRLISGDPNALAWQTGKVFQQNADYQLGRLMFRITSSFASLNGKENASVYFTVTREIGAF